MTIKPLKRRTSGPLLAAAISLASVGTGAIPALANGATVKVAYSLDYLFATPELATKWFTDIKAQFEKAHPGDTLQLIPIPGGYDDYTTKISLLFNSPSTAPDIIQYAAVTVGQFAASGLLAPLDDRLKNESWWKEFPQSVKDEGQVDGKVYGVSQGINTFGLLYDRTLFAKAGLPRDWSPKSWKDILDAGRAIKKGAPDASPIWLITGTSQGTFGVVMGPGMLMAASSTPTIYDSKEGKWVADSKGLREVLGFYRDASAEGLLAPSSQIMDPNAANNSGPLIAKHTMGIIFAGNWIPEDWGKNICLPCWDDPDKSIGFAPVPTSLSQAPGMSATFGGWDLSVYKNSQNPDLTWSVVDIMQEKQNMLSLGAGVLVVPPVPAYSTEPYYLDLAAKPFQEDFAKLVPTSTSMPSNPEFPVWANAFQQATQMMVLKPQTSIDDGIKVMHDYLANQLGGDHVTALK